MICLNLRRGRCSSTCPRQQWRQRVSNIGGTTSPSLLPCSPPLPSPPFPSLPHLTPSPPSPPLPLEVGSLNPTRGSGGALLAPPAGSGAEPQPKSNLVHFSLKIRHLMAKILMILVKSQLTEKQVVYIVNTIFTITLIFHYIATTNIGGGHSH